MASIWTNSVRTILGEIRDFAAPSSFSSLKEFKKCSDDFDKKNPFPVSTTKCKNLKRSEGELLSNINGCYPLVHEDVLSLACVFLDMKRSFGTNKEKKLYAEINVLNFFDRLLSKRPLVFMNSNDYYRLKDSKTRGYGGFENIGKDSETPPLLLENLMSYDEIKLAALVNFSGPTAIINSGSRQNSGVPNFGNEPFGHAPFEPHAIYVGLVGARFERDDAMESQEIYINGDRDASRGYGTRMDRSLNDAKASTCLELMAQLYDQPYGFPSYEDMSRDCVADKIKERLIRPMERYDGTPYFNAEVYKKRIHLSVFPFLAEANHRAKLASKRAYVHVVGLGLGVWKIFQDQNELFVEVFADILKTTKFEAISDVDFSYIHVSNCGGAKNGDFFPGTNIKMRFSRRDPFAKMQGEDAGKLIVASWAYDGNSFIGNEYWDKSLTGSGDPAAACCSQIPEILNPCINRMMGANNLHVATKEGNVVSLKAFVESSLE